MKSRAGYTIIYVIKWSTIHVHLDTTQVKKKQKNNKDLHSENIWEIQFTKKAICMQRLIGKLKDTKLNRIIQKKKQCLLYTDVNLICAEQQSAFSKFDNRQNE